MTVIIGVLCSDGVALAADGAATYTLPSGDFHTIRQTTDNKLVRIAQTQMLGTSGAIALQQAFADLIFRHSSQVFQQVVPPNSPIPQQVAVSAIDPNQKRWSRAEVRDFAHNQLFNNCVGPATQRSNQIIQMTGNRGYSGDAIQTTLFGFVDEQSTPQLALITPTCQVEFASTNLSFFGIGSGQASADPYFAFLRNVFCKPGAPISIKDGKFLAYWAVDLTIDAGAPGVGGPIQLMTLQNGKTGWEVLSHDPAEITTHQEMVKALKEEMQKKRNILTADTDSEVPPLPPHAVDVKPEDETSFSPDADKSTNVQTSEQGTR